MSWDQRIRINGEFTESKDENSKTLNTGLAPEVEPPPGYPPKHNTVLQAGSDGKHAILMVKQWFPDLEVIV